MATSLHFLNVAGLRELDLAALELRDLDVEKIGDGALVLDLPVHLQLIGEGVVDRGLVIVRVEGEQVVDVAADDQGLLARRAARRLDGLVPGEHARVALGGDEALLKEV